MANGKYRLFFKVYNVGIYKLSEICNHEFHIPFLNTYGRSGTSKFSTGTSNNMNLNYMNADEMNKITEDTSNKNTKKTQEQIMKTEVQKNSLYNIKDVEILKNKLLSIGTYLTEINFDSIFLNTCAVEKCFVSGRSYFLSIYVPGKCTVATIGKFFRLCYECREECVQEDKEFIWDLYNELLRRYTLLDSTTCENAALALSGTDKWRECLKLLEMCSETTSPPTKMYSEVIIAALKNGDINLGWKLLNEMVQQLKKPTVEVYECFLKVSNFHDNSFIELLKFFELNGLELSQDEAFRLIKSFKKRFQKTSFSFIQPSGQCTNCHTYLNPSNMTDEEFNKLRTFFLNPVLIGDNIFVKTKPSEFNSYVNFLMSVGKVDVVLDGLNIAYTGNNKKGDNKSFVLQRVVEHFVNQNKKVIVFGRKHLANLRAFNYIKKNAYFFLTEDISSDDPFLLYAAIHSGYGTYFLSRDQMRGHKFLLKDEQLKTIFSKWQQKFQYYLQTVTNNGQVFIRNPLPYQVKTQESRHGIWHIPIVTDTTNVPGHLKTIKSQWLCLS